MTLRLLNVVKDKKVSRVNLLNGYTYNHPHRLFQISLSGDLNYVRDERLFSSAGLSANVDTYNVDFTTFLPWNRIIVEKAPFIGSPGATPINPAAGEFIFGHQPQVMWRATFIGGDYPDPQICGTHQTDFYTRPTLSDPWTLYSTSSIDLEGYFITSISAGGLPPSHGRGTGSATENCSILIAPEISPGSIAGALGLTGTVKRLPWVDPWPSESALFAGQFAAALAALNLLDGGGHSGTCYMQADFT